MTEPSLKERCLDEALRVISENGVDALSLRSVARKLGVSHQAPYKHFASKDALLVEVIRQCLRRFALHLEASGDGADPIEDMRALGDAYLEYALAFPLEYQLMFSTQWPDAAEESAIEEDAKAAFTVLRNRLTKVVPSLAAHALDNHAMFVWSSMHGIAGILQSGSMKHLGMSAHEQGAALDHLKTVIEHTILLQIHED